MRCAPPEKISCLAASASGALLVAAGASGRLYLWECSSGQLLAQWEAHYRAVRALVFLAEDLVASGGEDGLIRVWSAPEAAACGDEALEPLASWAEHALPITSLQALPGPRLLSSSLDRSCRLWRPPQARSLECVSVPAPVLCCALSDSAQTLLLGCADGSLHESSAGLRGPVRAHAAAHAVGVSAVALSPDARLAASGGQDGTCRVWALPSFQLLLQLERHRGPVQQLRFFLERELPLEAQPGEAPPALAKFPTPSDAAEVRLRLPARPTTPAASPRVPGDARLREFAQARLESGRAENLAAELERARFELQRSAEELAQARRLNSSLYRASLRSLLH